MAHSVLELHPEDVHQEEIDFSLDLPNDTSITLAIEASDSDGVAQSGIINTSSTDGMTAYVTFSGMVDGEDYGVYVGATGGDTNQQKIRLIELRCRSVPGMF